MGYRALLFCPDQKTAQTVTLVLNDLDFAVEACSEPFAAVKKLMGEQFDGVVVDCDNEPNAALLFKSARQSAANQASLAVALVEGQAGVARAFRIGANLILTKPINAEQAKGTLRVARGLLRKSDAAKSSAHAETLTTAPSASLPSRPRKGFPDEDVAQTATSASPVPVSAAPRPASTPAVVPAPWVKRVADAAPAVAPVLTRDLAADEVSAGEADGDSASNLPSNSAFRSISPSRPASPTVSPAVPKASSPLASPAAAFGASPLSPAAPERLPRPAPQEANSAEPLLSKIARTMAPMDESIHAREGQPSVAAKAPRELPSRLDNSQSDSDPYALELQTIPETKPKTQRDVAGGTKILMAAAAVVLLLLALYLGWTQLLRQPLHLGSTLGDFLGNFTSAKSQPPPTNVPPAAASAAPVSSPVSSSAGPRDLPPTQDAEQTGADSVGAAEEGDSDTNDEPANYSRKTASAGATAQATKSGSRTLVVRSGKKAGGLKPAADATAPSVTLSAGGTGESLPNLIDASVRSTPVLQALAISEGAARRLIVKKVQPSYPDAALRLHLAGPVQLLATIGRNGSVTAVKTISGEPMLAQAAADAVRQWKYKPYLVDGDPVEIQTQVTINFKPR